MSWPEAIVCLAVISGLCWFSIKDLSMKSCKKFVIVESVDNELHHISMSHPHRLPTWEEIKWVRDKFGDPKKFYAMVLPPKEFYVNLHQFCMHLWEVKSDHEIKTWSEMKVIEDGKP